MRPAVPFGTTKQFQRRKTQAVFFSRDENMAVLTIRNTIHPPIGEFSFSTWTTARNRKKSQALRERKEDNRICQCENYLYWAYSICHLEIPRVCGQFGRWPKVRECEPELDRAFHSKKSRRFPFVREVQWADKREIISSRINTTRRIKTYHTMWL